MLHVRTSLAFFAASVAAQTPAWSQFRATAQHTGMSTLPGPPPATPRGAWSFPSPDGTAVISSPAIAGDGTIVFMTQGGLVVAVEPLAAAPSWTCATLATPLFSEQSPAISFAGNLVYVAAGSRLFVLSMTDGTITQTYNTQPYGYGNFIASPSVATNYLAIPTTTGVLVFPANYISSPQYISSYVPTGPITSIDNDPSYSYCIFYVSSTNLAVKLCPTYNPTVAVWTFPLSESSSFAPVVVASLGVVFFVTNGPVAYVYGVISQSASVQSFCSSTGQLNTTLGGAPAWVGGNFGLAVVSSLGAGAAVLLTGPFANSSCILTASIPGTAPSAGSSLAIDVNRTAYYGSSNGSLIAVDLSRPVPFVAWTSVLLSGSSSPVMSSSAVGSSTNIAVGFESSIVVVQPICGAGYYYQTVGGCLPCPANSYQPLTNVSAGVCTLCPAGSDTAGNTSGTSLAACAPCAAGLYNPAPGGSCRGCAAGSFSGGGGANCSLCPAGSSSSIVNATNVTVCAACAPGFVSSAGSAACVGCAAGSWAPGGTSICSSDSQACFTAANASADCDAVLPYAQYGADTTHSSLVAGAGPVALPLSVERTRIFSSNRLVSGLALGPSGGVVANLPVDSLFFVGTQTGVLGVSSVNGAIVNAYDTPAIAFPGSPAVAPWGWVFAVDANFKLYALPALEAAAPFWVYSPPNGVQAGYTVTPPAVHSATRAVYYNAGPSGIACVDGIAGTARWVWAQPNSEACSSTPALDLLGARVYVSCDDKFVYALSAAAGQVLWSYRTGGSPASPSLSADGSLLFVVTTANNLLTLDASSGALRWLPVALSPAAALASPAVADGVVIVALADGTVFAANSTFERAVKWTVQLDGAVVAPPTIGAADASSGTGSTAYIGTLAGSLYAVDVSSGAVRWNVSLGEPLAQPAVILARGDTLLVPSNASAAVFSVRGNTASPSVAATATATPSATAAAQGDSAPSALVISLSVALSVSVLGLLAAGAYSRGLIGPRWRPRSTAWSNEKESHLNPLRVERESAAPLSVE